MTPTPVSDDLVLADAWYGCYDAPWRGVLLPAAVAHPAKLAWRLAQRGVQHARELGWLVPGRSVVLDPMAGVGTVGLACARRGVQALLGELEAVWAGACRQTVAAWRPQLAALGHPVPWLVQHAARALPVRAATCILTSPPSGGTWEHDRTQAGRDGRRLGRGYSGRGRSGFRDGALYGAHPAQLGALPLGVVGVVLTSPPYAGAVHAQNGIDPARCRGKGPGRHSQMTAGGYGSHPAQLGTRSRHTYWTAMRAVYQACWAVLPPGGHLLLVLKGGVRQGCYVDLPGQTAQLLAALGFRLLHRHRVMQTSREAQRTLDGREERARRVSFFRRLAERQGAPVVDWEEVLCAANPCEPCLPPPRGATR